MAGGQTTLCTRVPRVCDGMPEPHPKSLHLIDATDVSALFYYFTNVTKHSVENFHILILHKKHKGQPFGQAAAKQEEKGPTNKSSCLLWMSHSPGLSSLPGDPEGHTGSFREQVSVRVLSAASERKSNSLSGLNKEAGWLQV